MIAALLDWLDPAQFYKGKRKNTFRFSLVLNIVSNRLNIVHSKSKFKQKTFGFFVWLIILQTGSNNSSKISYDSFRKFPVMPPFALFPNFLNNSQPHST